MVRRGPVFDRFSVPHYVVFNRTGENSHAFHLTSNVVGGALVLPLFAGTDQDRFCILFVVFACILALRLNGEGGWNMGRLGRPKQSSVPT